MGFKPPSRLICAGAKTPHLPLAHHRLLVVIGLDSKSGSSSRARRMDRGMVQMRRMTITAAVIAAIAASYGIGRYHSRSEAGGKTVRRALYYVDPMHPAYRSDKPGIA